MFGATPAKSGLTFSKVLGGISKTLSVANQIIPLYQQAKPMINNAKNILGVLKNIRADNSPKESGNKVVKTTETPKEGKIITAISTNSPIFFQ